MDASVEDNAAQQVEMHQSKWLDHYNFDWINVSPLRIHNRSDLEEEFSKLIKNKEIVIPKRDTFDVPRLRLPDYNSGTPTIKEQQHYIDLLIKSQLLLARHISSECLSESKLHMRLAVLQRIYYAYHTKFHDAETSREETQVQRQGSENSSKEQNSEMSPSLVQKNPTDVLVELGVRTGLQLVFSLIRVSWSQPVVMSSLCNDTLKTAITVMANLPPLTLANANKIPAVGSDCLVEVGKFLKSASMPDSGADSECSRLACELLLAIAFQRGSLPQLLEWIELALNMSTARKRSSDNARISSHLIISTLRSIKQSEDSETQNGSKSAITGEFVDVERAALVLLEEIVNLSTQYLNSCSSFGNGTSEKLGEPKTCEVFAWGSNSSHQLGEAMQEKILQPKKINPFAQAQTIEAGQYCSFMTSLDGQVWACGKGSYGRLGLGTSNNQPNPKLLKFDPPVPIKRISSSKGSDGHTLALSFKGQVFSWGDGDYGKLGHGSGTTQKYPKLIQGPLSGKIVVSISAGYRHSACVTSDGELYTWGEGDYGRLGHGNNNSKNVPTLVRDVNNAGQVVCGSSHTVVVSQDRTVVWSFGGGDNGKLGHGDTSRVYRPKVIEGLAGVFIRKVCAGSQSTLALTTSGQVYAWGCGACLGWGSAEATLLKPAIIQFPAAVRVVDIACGDGHCLALTHENEVYAWGNNAMGQCGLSHSSSPVTTPSKVAGLEGKQIQQISAGTSHTVVWTALPQDRQAISWHRPYCVELQESLFKQLRTFLETYCQNFTSESVEPFQNSSDHQKFVLLCLRLLRTHLHLAHIGSLSSQILGKESQPMRNLLFHLIDQDAPTLVEEAIVETLSVGSSLLLPSLNEQVEVLLDHLPHKLNEWKDLSRGQRMQVEFILKSLVDHVNVSCLMGFSKYKPVSQSKRKPMLLLMEALLNNIKFHTARSLELSKDLLSKSPSSSEDDEFFNDLPIDKIHALLALLQNHLLAHCFHTQYDVDNDPKILQEYLVLLCSAAGEMLTELGARLKKDASSLKCLNDLNLEISCAGSLLSVFITSLLMLDSRYLSETTDDLLNLINNLDAVNRNLKLNDALPFAWVEDLECACALLIGRTLCWMSLGNDMNICSMHISWLTSSVLCNGLEPLLPLLKNVERIIPNIAPNSHDTESPLLEQEVKDFQSLLNWPEIVDMAFGIKTDWTTRIFNSMNDVAQNRGWNTCNTSDPALTRVSEVLLATLLKHTCSKDQTTLMMHNSQLMIDNFRSVYKVRSYLHATKFQKSITDDPVAHQEVTEIDIEAQQSNTESERSNKTEGTSKPKEGTSDWYFDSCRSIIQRCFFLLFFVKPDILACTSNITSIPSQEETIGSPSSRSQSLLTVANSEYNFELQKSRKTRSNTSNISSKIPEDAHIAWHKLLKPSRTLSSESHKSQKLASQETLVHKKLLGAVLEFCCADIVNPIPGFIEGLSTVSSEPSTSGTTLNWHSDIGNQEELSIGFAPRAKLPRNYDILEIMKCHQNRGQARADALEKILSLIRDWSGEGAAFDKAVTPSAFLSFLCGCFGISSIKSDSIYLPPSMPLSDFLTGVTFSGMEIQSKIQSHVHSLRNSLLTLLQTCFQCKDVMRDEEKLKLALTCISVLGVSKFNSSDLIHVAEKCLKILKLTGVTGHGVEGVELPYELLHSVLASHTAAFTSVKRFQAFLSVSSGILLQTLTIAVSASSINMASNALLHLVLDVVLSRTETMFESIGGCLHDKDNVLKLCLVQIQQNSGAQESSNSQSENLQHFQETALGDFLSFLHHLLSSDPVKSIIATSQWTGLLLSIAGQLSSTGLLVVRSLRVRLLALRILSFILPLWQHTQPCTVPSDDSMSSSGIDANEEIHSRSAASEASQLIVKQILQIISNAYWVSLPAAKQTYPVLSQSVSKAESVQGEENAMKSDDISKNGAENLSIADSMFFTQLTFDPQKCTSVTIEDNTTVLHSSEGRAYAMTTTGISQGCCEWKFTIAHENPGNEGTCVGISLHPPQDCQYRTTNEMWLYRAYSGNLYHGGEQSRRLPPFSVDDVVTCVLDTRAKTLSFGINGAEPQIAFENLGYPSNTGNPWADCDAPPEFYPCVVFYSCNPGEKVQISDLKMGGLPQDLHPGDPVCAPKHTVLAEECIQLLRKLHQAGRDENASLYYTSTSPIISWTSVINREIQDRFEDIWHAEDKKYAEINMENFIHLCCQRYVSFMQKYAEINMENFIHLCCQRYV